MRYNQLGRTGLFVSEICLGTMTFGGAGKGSPWDSAADVDQSGATKILERALAAGVNFIDTADIYSLGSSEEHLGRGLKDLGVPRADVVLSTKVYEPMSGKPNDRGASRGHIMDAVARSLERLNTDHIDLYQIHADDSVTPIEESLRALDDLVHQGMVRYAGVSNWQAWKIAKALGISDRLGIARFESVQAYYSIAGRDLEREIVPLLGDEKLGLMVWSPLAGGLLSGKYGPGALGPGAGRRANFDFPPVNLHRAWECVATMREVAKRHDASVATVALAWVLSKSFVTSVIIGAKRIEQLDENLAATRLSLDGHDLKALDAVSALPAEYPGWMLELQGVTRIPAPFESNS
jgi:aryl-alcohol dehydrogenase-like predicted oxidoreductase